MSEYVDFIYLTYIEVTGSLVVLDSVVPRPSEELEAVRATEAVLDRDTWFKDCASNVSCGNGEDFSWLWNPREFFGSWEPFSRQDAEFFEVWLFSRFISWNPEALWGCGGGSRLLRGRARAGAGAAPPSARCYGIQRHHQFSVGVTGSEQKQAN